MVERTCWIAQEAPRWLARLYYAWGWIAYRLILILPLNRRTSVLLPAAGVWACSDSFNDWLSGWRPAPTTGGDNG